MARDRSAYMAMYRKTHAAQLAANNKRYRQNHPEKVLEWTIAAAQRKLDQIRQDRADAYREYWHSDDADDEDDD